MSIKVNFEIGHEASIRTKKTPEGFTHDWEVFVRGIDTADISQFVDKIVFQLHDTFPKPKRVVKEPPYCVRESGYAGFNLPIDIYLKNRDEPKKITFNYDLHLQQSGPAIIKKQKEKHVFTNPSEEFRRKLVKGGGMIVTNTNPFSLHSNIDHERNSRDSFTDEKPQQLIGKPKLGGDSSKKHKSKEHKSDDLPRPTNHFVTLFGTPIHKTSRVSPDPRKPSPSPKMEKKEKDKSYSEKDKSKMKHELKDKEHREEKSSKNKEDKEKLKEEKRFKPHKEKDSSREKSKRPAERPPSPVPLPKRPVLSGPSSPKSNGSLPHKEELKSTKYSEVTESKSKHSSKIPESDVRVEKKVKKDKKSHDKDREAKKEHKKEKEAKIPIISEIKEIKPKDTPVKENVVKEKDKTVIGKPEKLINKFSIENMLKDPTESTKHIDGSKHKEKGDRERKHKHKKKDKKRDESRDKNKESSTKDKKHKHDKHVHKEKVIENKEIFNVIDVDTNAIPREIDKIPVKSFKEKDRSLLTISPISVDTSSQSSSKSLSKASKSGKNPPGSMLETLSSSDSDASIMSEDEEVSLHSENNSRSGKHSSKLTVEPIKSEPVKSIPVPEIPKPEKRSAEKVEKGTPGSSHKSKNKDKSGKHESKEEKKQRKRKSSSKTEDSDVNVKTSKVEENDQGKNKRTDGGSNMPETNSRIKSEPSPRIKTDTKVQDDGVSSSLSDHPMKCDSPLSEDASQMDRKQISPDYMIQLKELQHRIMTIQSNDELERVVNLIAETGKYEVTKKTFDFDLCLLDRSTVQQLQELIGCESRA